MQGDPAALQILAGGPFRDPLDIGGAAGGANQRFLVSVRRDQYQRFRRAVLFDPPTSHGLPFRLGFWHGTGFAQPERNLSGPFGYGKGAPGASPQPEVAECVIC